MTTRETHLAQMLGDAQNVDRPARIQRLRGVDAEWTAEQGSFKAGDYRMGSGVTIYAALCAMRGEAPITDAPRDPGRSPTVQAMLDDLIKMGARVATLEADVAILNGHGGSKMHRDAGFSAGVAAERERCAKIAHEISREYGNVRCLDVAEAIRDPNRQPKP